jgi:hypothetical protein
MGVRPGETMDEVLVGDGERLGDEVWSGVAGIERVPAPEVASLVEEVERRTSGEERRAVWLAALGPAPVPTR